MALRLRPQPTGIPGGSRSHDLWSDQSALEGQLGQVRRTELHLHDALEDDDLVVVCARRHGAQ